MARLRLRVPDTFVLLGAFLVAVAALTWVLPGGSYAREVRDGRELVVSGSFERVAAEPQGLADVLTAPVEGFVAAALIIGFVLLVGGAFGVLAESGAIEAGIHALATAPGRAGRWVRRLWIPVFMVLFSLGGAVFGMGEELIPFVLLFVPLSLALGYDRVVGVAVPFVASQAGFAGAFLNPFSLGIAHGIAGLPLFSGMGYRLVVWSLVTLVAILYVMAYAERVRKRPERSLTWEQDRGERDRLSALEPGVAAALTGRRAAVLVVFGIGMVVLSLGVVLAGWYIEEIAALFLAVGLLAGAVAGLRPARISRAFVEGARHLVGTAFVIALARGILVVAEDGRIIDTVLHALSAGIGRFPAVVSAWLMFLVQSVLNLLVPSGSGQAALTMPIMAPLADLVGLTRQTAVLAFQLGDGFSNMIIPTSAVCMGILTTAELEWARWARWVLPLQALLLLLGFLLLVPPVLTGWR